MSAISPATNSTAITLRSSSFERQANNSRIHEGPFCTLPDILLKEILRKLPLSDPAALNLMSSQVSLFARSVYGVTRDDISQIKHFLAQPGEEPTSAQDFRKSILAIQNPNLAFKAEIAGAFVGQIEAIFETELQIPPSEFHDILGRNIIKARYPSKAENQFQMAYAKHLCLAFNLQKFLKKDNSPNLHAMLNLDRLRLDREEVNRHFTNQNRAVAAIRECASTESTKLDLSTGTTYMQRLYAVPPHISQLVNLEDIDLFFNFFNTLPAEISQLVKLTKLNLHFSHLKTLTADIGQLVTLTELNLHYNYLSALPVEIDKLVNLKKLILSNNQLTTLPAEIGKLVNLENIDLSNNRLTTLPAEFSQLVKLTRTSLFGNKFIQDKAFMMILKILQDRRTPAWTLVL